MGQFIPSTQHRDTGSKAWRYVKRILVTILVIGCIVVLANFVLKTAFEAIDASLQKTQVTMLSETTASNSLENAQVDPPDVSGYAYIETTNFVGPRFAELTIGDLYEQEVDGQTAYLRDVTTTATFRNSSVSVVAPVTQRFTYEKDTGAWIGGEVELGQARVTPLHAPNTYALEAGLPALLEAADPQTASQLEGASTSFDSSMDATGGTVVATLSKTTGAQSLHCDVILSVTWLDGAGWQVNITSVGNVTRGNVEEDLGEPTMVLTCKSGDLVKLVGTIESVDGHAVLKTSYVIKVDMENRSWVTNKFELVSESGAGFSFGSTESVQGTITAAGAINNVPLRVTVS